MRYLRWAGLVSGLLFVGVLGELMAPLPSEAVPTLKIGNANVPLVSRPCGTDTGYNSCWSIPSTTVHSITPTRVIDGWYVGNASATNTARVLINDASATGSRDSMKMTGITFTPVAPLAAPGRTVRATVQNVYNAGGGNLSGDYQWAMAQGGQFDPPSTENIVGNRLKLTGTGTANSVNFPLGVLDTGTFTSSTIPNVIGYVTKSKAASVVKPNCNTGSNRCAPTIKYDYDITVVGGDTLFLTDSVFGAGGPCYKGLKLLLAKLIDHIFDKFDALKDDEHPLGCKKFAEEINEDTQIAVEAIVQAGIASGGVAVETCEGACIVINKTTDPVLNRSFVFTGTGAGINNFTITTDDQICEDDVCVPTGTGGTTFSGLTTGQVSRKITETGFPYEPDTFDDVPPEQSDHDAFWWTRSVSCESTLSGNVGNVGPSLWTTFAPTFNDVHNNRFALGNDASLPNENPLPTDPEIAPVRQGYVDVSNLAAGDTLTCTFDNRLYNDDDPDNNPDSD